MQWYDRRSLQVKNPVLNREGNRIPLDVIEPLIMEFGEGARCYDNFDAARELDGEATVFVRQSNRCWAVRVPVTNLPTGAAGLKVSGTKVDVVEEALRLTGSANVAASPPNALFQAYPPHGHLHPDSPIQRAYHDTERFHREWKVATMADETSFSHLFRGHNSFLLGGRPYGGALYRRIVELGLITSESPSILEVGGGLGDVAYTGLRFLLPKYPGLHYTIVDIAPALIAAQKEKLAGYGGCVECRLGNAEKLGDIASGVDLLVSNEVVADLTTIVNIPLGGLGNAPVTGNATLDEENRRWWGVAMEYVDKYGLTLSSKGEKSTPAINLGAYRLLESLQNVLSPNGCAFLTEWGFWDRVVRKELRGHEEYALQANNFIRVAEANGFNVQHGNIADLFSLDPNRGYVYTIHVNLWLMLGGDPSVLESMGGQHERRVIQASSKFVREPQRYSPYDIALTAEEFQRYAQRRNWDIPNPETVNLGKQAQHLMYFALTKIKQ